MKPQKGQTRFAWMKAAVPHFMSEDGGAMTAEAATEAAANLYDLEGDPSRAVRGEHVAVKAALKRTAFDADEVKRLCKARGIEYTEGDEKYCATFEVSNERVDRDGDIVDISGGDFKNFLANPVMLYVHDSYSIPIGAWIDLKKEKDANGERIVATGLFHRLTDTAKAIGQLCMMGFIRATSIGFSCKYGGVYYPNESERTALGMRPGGVIFRSWELFEISICPIPANPYALAREVAKSMTPAVRRFGIDSGILNATEDFSDLDREFEENERKAAADALAEKERVAREAAAAKAAEERIDGLFGSHPEFFGEKNQTPASRIDATLESLAKFS